MSCGSVIDLVGKADSVQIEPKFGIFSRDLLFDFADVSSKNLRCKAFGQGLVSSSFSHWHA
jgi:hypothetical protein